MMTKNSPKIAKIFECIKCDYECSKESDFKKHLATRKHQKDANELHQTRDTAYECECGKTYKFRQGLSVHKKKCIGN